MKFPFKRFFSGMLSVVMAISAVPIVSIHAEESIEPYPYTMFAASSDEGAITLNAGNFCVNGNIATNGTIASSGNININGTKTENAMESMIFIFDKIDNQYFLTSNIDEHEEDYILDEMNININVPTEVQGEAKLTGNININSALKALEDVNLYGEVKNTNDAIIFSQYGDIIIDSQNVNLNGLIYAPFGNVNITAQNLNLNNVVIIAESIVLTCPDINANYGSNSATFVGTESEECPMIVIDTSGMAYSSEYGMYYATSELESLNGILGKPEEKTIFRIEVFDMMRTLIYSQELTPEFKWTVSEPGLMCGLNYVVVTAEDKDGTIYTKEIKLLVDSSKFVGFMQVDLEDSDGDELWNYIETFLGTDPENPDTDGDELSDWVEIYTLGYNPLEIDTDGDGILDGDEDEDEDGLTNSEEVNIYQTSPIFSDTDCEGLLDGQELEIGTSPLNPDTDGDGLSDYDEYYNFNTDPLQANPDDITLTKIFTADDISGETDPAVLPTLELHGDASCIKSFQMYMMERTADINVGMVGYLGAAYDFSASGRIDSATLTFSYDPDLILEADQSEENFEPAIYYYNEQTCRVEEVENQEWNGNQVTAELEHFSIYLLLNKKALELFWDSPQLFPETDEVEVSPYKQIAFLLDRSGSMNTNDPQDLRVKLVNEFTSQLGNQDSIMLYGFGSDLINFTEYGPIHLQETIEEATNSYIALGNSGLTYIAAALEGVYEDLCIERTKFETLAELSDDKDAKLEQYIFLLTDGISYDEPSSTFLTQLKDAGIKVYTVGFGNVNEYYLRRIADATNGKSYFTDSTSNFKDIYLKFGEDIKDNDKNGDGIPDYYEYMMCMGEITTMQGNRVFLEDDYQELMSNKDFDDDGLSNGQEVFVAEVNGKLYAFMSSDPRLKYSDEDDYTDYEERQMGTSAWKPNILVEQDDYFDIENGSGFVYAEVAEEYVNRNEVGLALAYFTDIAFCGCESYINIILSGAESAYYELNGSENTVGSLNLLVNEDKDVLVNYLTNVMERDVSEDDCLIMLVIDCVKYINTWMDELAYMTKNKVDVKGVWKEFLANKKLSKVLEEERAAISQLQSVTDQMKNVRKTGRKLTRTERNLIKENMGIIAKRQSELHHGIFEQNAIKDLGKRYENNFKKFGNAFSAFIIVVDSVNEFSDLIDYSNKLATFQEYRELLDAISHSEFEYAAEAAKIIIKDIDESAESSYAGRGTGEFMLNLCADVWDQFVFDCAFSELARENLSKAIGEIVGKAVLDAAAVVEIARLIGHTVVSNNLSYNRQNLISADMTTEITKVTLDKVAEACGTFQILPNGSRGVICEGVDNCITVSQYMEFCIMGKRTAEEKYISLAQDRSGVLGWCNYNPLDDSESTINKATSNINRMNTLLDKYVKVYAT